MANSTGVHTASPQAPWLARGTRCTCSGRCALVRTARSRREGASGGSCEGMGPQCNGLGKAGGAWPCFVSYSRLTHSNMLASSSSLAGSAGTSTALVIFAMYAFLLPDHGGAGRGPLQAARVLC
eukprot:365702-Chlamydomonas_euryale.AAC.36